MSQRDHLSGPALLDALLGTSSDEEGCQPTTASADSVPVAPVQDASRSSSSIPVNKQNITTALELHERSKRSLIFPSKKQMFKIVKIRAWEETQTKRFIFSPMGVSEIRGVVGKHKGECADCPVPGVRWDKFGPVANVARIVNDIQQLAKREDVSKLVAGISTDVQWRYYCSVLKGSHGQSSLKLKFVGFYKVPTRHRISLLWL